MYYNGELFLAPEEDGDPGIENTRSVELYEFSEKPKMATPQVRATSTPSFKTESAVSLKDVGSVSVDSDSRRAGTPVLMNRKNSRSKTHLVQGVPQTDV